MLGFLFFEPLYRVLDASVLGLRVPETPRSPGLSPATSVSLGWFSCASSTSVFWLLRSSQTFTPWGFTVSSSATTFYTPSPSCLSLSVVLQEVPHQWHLEKLSKSSCLLFSTWLNLSENSDKFKRLVFFSAQGKKDPPNLFSWFNLPSIIPDWSLQTVPYGLQNEPLVLNFWLLLFYMCVCVSIYINLF